MIEPLNGLKLSGPCFALAMLGVASPASAAFDSSGLAPAAPYVLSAAAIAGSALFLTMVCVLFLKASREATRSERRAAEEISLVSRRLDLAHSIMTAEPQALIVCEKDEAPRLAVHTLSASAGIPAKARMLFRFASWAERDAALELEGRFKNLRDSGEAFILIFKSLEGAAIEAEGRASGNFYYLRFRDLAGRRLDIANLMAQIKSQTEDLAAKNALFDALPIPVWFRGSDGRLKWVNKAYAASVEAPWADDVIEKQLELLEAQQRQMADAELVKGDVFRRRLQTIVGGGRRTFETVVVPIGRASAGAVIDVAPLETAQETLSRHMAAHARTLDRVATAAAIFGPDQRLVFYNQAYSDFWRLDAPWLDAKPKLGEIFDRLRQGRQLPEQLNYRAWRAEQLKAYEATEAREDCWHLPDGRSVLAVTDQRPDGGVTLLYEDVTEKLALESRYNALIHVQRETLDNLREGVAVFGPDGRLRLYNPAFISIWRLGAGVVENLPHIDELADLCKHLQGDEDAWSVVRQAVTSAPETRQGFEGQLSRADGSVISYAAVPLPDGGTLLAYVDITDGKRAELALIERNEALEAADRLKNAFISHVSRELRTPLTNIIGFSELLASPRVGLMNAKQREYLNDIRSSSVALLSIINDILDLAFIDAGALELQLGSIAVQEVAEAAELGVRNRLEQGGLKLEIHVDPDAGHVFADGPRLTQILFNLLSNAIGFSEEGSLITLKCEGEKDDVAFTVQDMGCGIPEEFQKTVFERFESRAHGSAHRGAGLGLALVKSLVEMHGGDIRLRSAPGTGTTVTVLIPRGGPRRLNLGAADEAPLQRAGVRAISAIFS